MEVGFWKESEDAPRNVTGKLIHRPETQPYWFVLLIVCVVNQ
jgi:hypothetical protein